MNSIKNYERGDSYPSSEHLFELIQILQLSIDRLCFDEYGLSDLGLGDEIQAKIIEVCVINSFKPPAVRTVETGRSVSLSVPHEPFAVPASGTDRALHRTSA